MIKHLDRYQYRIGNVRIDNLHARRYCVFDLEGTGPDVKHDFITQIGAVIVENGAIVENCFFNTFVRSPKPIPEEIERLTNIRNEDIAYAPPFADIYNEFRSFIGNKTVLIAQCGFEYDFELLQNEIVRNQLESLPNAKMDTKVLFAALHPEIKNTTFSTDYLLKYYNINHTDVQRHSALGDSILISRILAAILREYKEKNINDLVIDDEIEIRKFVIG